MLGLDPAPRFFASVSLDFLSSRKFKFSDTDSIKGSRNFLFMSQQTVAECYRYKIKWIYLLMAQKYTVRSLTLPA